MSDFLPRDWREALLVGRMEFGDGPTPVVIRDGRVEDCSAISPTVAGLLDTGLDAILSGKTRGRDLGAWEDLNVRPAWDDAKGPRLLAPVDLQCIKAAGVTFAASTMERMIEERTHGDASKAEEVRKRLESVLSFEISSVVPGSAESEKLKAALLNEGLWSQYLEVAVGPHAEIFTKAPVLSSVAWGDYIGVRSDSHWNNPEPEVVIICNPQGQAVGATLGNDVNLRDFEGRSALLLGKAKDNNASCSLGPFIRLFDGRFTIDNVRKAEVELTVVGRDNFTLTGLSSMTKISRDPLELARQAQSEHQYPDGFALFLGTMFAPTTDRGTPGQGFTHKEGDVVRISSAALGTLENRVTTSKSAPPWIFGISKLMANLAKRGLLRPAE